MTKLCHPLHVIAELDSAIQSSAQADDNRKNRAAQAATTRLSVILNLFQNLTADRCTMTDVA
jgi:hypothetical protein